MKTVGLISVAAFLLTGCPSPWCDFVPGAKCDEKERQYVAFEDWACPGMGLDRQECSELVFSDDCADQPGPQVCLGTWQGW
jgi:hypothetical protein